MKVAPFKSNLSAERKHGFDVYVSVKRLSSSFECEVCYLYATEEQIQIHTPTNTSDNIKCNRNHLKTKTKQNIAYTIGKMCQQHDMRDIQRASS